ncbi:MAG: CheR family methyltransferase [Leptolyngbyaceae cyanobacterium bins.59]|nr:CheR family methyltransferase [Leptolyngbyaceae cyanobacterium bins.59]
MDEQLSQKFSHLITSATGLCIRPQDLKAMQEKVLLRMKALRFSHPEQYYQHLLAYQAGMGLTLSKGENEWQRLIALLTTGESYFFRDQGQFRLLREQLLPDLIRQRSQETRLAALRPQLKIWSAGCSTGEEVYSLAILVSELIPDRTNWNISILGTDINAEAIEKAQKGIFGPWSFRTFNPSTQPQYFHPQRENWQVDEELRQMVTFRTGNLVQDPLPNLALGLSNIDLIVCRNVFIYFDTATIALILEKFSQTLRVSGCLITGHAELHNQKPELLVSKLYAESVVYQRRDSRTQPSLPTPEQPALFPSLPSFLSTPPLPTSSLSSLPKTPAIPAAAPPPPASNPLEPVEKLFAQKDYGQVIAIGQSLLTQTPASLALFLLLARSHANLGNHEQAKTYCQQGIALNSLSAEPYYLLAQIAQEEGHFEEAKRFLKQVIYLTPNRIMAYVDLGLLYEQEGDRNRAKKMQQTAIEQLQRLPTEAQVDEGRNVTVGELLQNLQTMLRNNS